MLEFISVWVRVCWSLLVSECMYDVVYWCVSACMLECVGV